MDFVNADPMFSSLAFLDDFGASAFVFNRRKAGWIRPALQIFLYYVTSDCNKGQSFD